MCQAKNHQHQLKVEVDGSVDNELREIEEEMEQLYFEMDELNWSSTASSGLPESGTESETEMSVAESRSNNADWIPGLGFRPRSLLQHRYDLRQARTTSQRYSPSHSPPTGRKRR